MDTVGAEVYPDPSLFKNISEMAPVAIVAVGAPGLVKATPSKLGDQYIYRATYILIKPE